MAEVVTMYQKLGFGGNNKKMCAKSPVGRWEEWGKMWPMRHRQYTYQNQLSDSDIRDCICRLGVPDDMNMTLSQYVNTVPWNAYSAALCNQSDIMDYSIFQLLVVFKR